MRQCKTCSQEKPLMDFYRQSNGNLQRDCKECWKAKVRANRLINIDHYREFDKARAMAPERVAARVAYSATERGKRAHARARNKFKEKHPAKRAAHIATGNAIRDGRLVRQPCEVCGNIVSQAHHDDYSKPLDVRWLCTTHHAEWHKNNKARCAA